MTKKGDRLRREIGAKLGLREGQKIHFGAPQIEGDRGKILVQIVESKIVSVPEADYREREYEVVDEMVALFNPENGELREIQGFK